MRLLSLLRITHETKRGISMDWALNFLARGRTVGAAALLGAAILGFARDALGEQVARSDTPAHHGSAFVDPLGFALFGPRIGAEAGGNHICGALYARWFSPGLLSHSLFLHSNESFGFSYGIGLRGRYYLGANQSGWHAGLAAEYLHSRVEDQHVRIVTLSSYVVPYAEGGYRLPLGAFYGDVSAGLGYAARLSGDVENLPGGTAAGGYVASQQSSVYGTASLELGVYF
jgi:hypothetical protein